MNAPEKLQLPDVQSANDWRELAIDRVGVRGVRYPVTVDTGERVVHSVGTWSLAVALPARAKGTHMSRFIELLEGLAAPLTPEALAAVAVNMLRRLEAESGTIEVGFPCFIAKTAPVSGISSLLDYQVTWMVSAAVGRRPAFRMKVVVPATSRCPCSKEISAYGAHNQRSHITIDAEILGALSIEDLVRSAEAGASCPVYGLLKRADEKYVTERAYDHPKFVEDLVRDIALGLEGERRIGDFIVEAENFESIHNHSAHARIDRRPG